MEHIHVYIIYSHLISVCLKAQVHSDKVLTSYMKRLQVAILKGGYLENYFEQHETF